MNTPLSALLALLAAATLTAGCRTGGATPPPGGPEPALYTLVYLRTGDAPPDLSPERRSELFTGHFAFMSSEAEARRLLLAGPFGAEKAADDLRGLFLYDEPDPAVALAHAASDPTTGAGVFRQEAFPLATSSVLRTIPDLEQARQEARAAAGEDMGSPDIQSYALLVADDGEAAADLIAHPALSSHVVLFGRMGAPRDGALFAVLSLADLDEVRARLKIAGTAGIDVELSEWFATPALLELRDAWTAPADGAG
ncbi:MAG: hypothetical protein AAGA20_23790 [Planctomycetota bacterium]